jgi:hypothetical protein
MILPEVKKLIAALIGCSAFGSCLPGISFLASKTAPQYTRSSCWRRRTAIFIGSAPDGSAIRCSAAQNCPHLFPAFETPLPFRNQLIGPIPLAGRRFT